MEVLVERAAFLVGVAGFPGGSAAAYLVSAENLEYPTLLMDLNLKV
jgi:hypothetical protein